MNYPILVTAPTKEPVTLDEFKTFAKVTTDAWNDDFEGLISTASLDVEEFTGRQLVTATRKLFLDSFTDPKTNCGLLEIELKYPPLQSVTSVRYRDTNGDWQTLLINDEYIVDTNGGGLTPDPISGLGRIYLPKDVEWPNTYDEPNSVEIIFVCGYPLNAANEPTTPTELKTAIKFIARSMYYECDKPMAVRSIMGKFRTLFHF